MLPLLLAALALPAAAAEPSLLRDRPQTALVDEVIELRPAAGRHFNVEAPQKCDGRPPLELLPSRLRCQLTRPGTVPVLVSVCDDALTFCRQERFTVKVSGVARAAALASPQAAAPKGGRRAPAGFLDNAPARARKLARKEGKLLLADFYGIWCPPCNDLEEHAYPDPAFRKASAAFVKVGLDADAETSFPWKARFKVGGYPTLVVADADLREIGRVVGYRSGPALARFLDRMEALRAEPVAEADRLAAAGGPRATPERRLRAARWRRDRAEYALAEARLKGLDSPEARRLALEIAREAAGARGDDAAAKAALQSLIREFPDAPDLADWADSLAGGDKAAGTALKDAVARSVARWAADPALADSGWDPGDLYWSQADFLDELGDSAAAKAAWSKAADAYAAQAARSPLAVPRAANFGRADALLHAGRTAQAKALYERLLKAYPAEFTFNYDYASVLESQGDAAAAYPYAVKAAAVSYGDNWLRAVRLKGELELALGRKAEAARTVDEALARTVPPKSAAVRTYRYVEALRALSRKISAAKG